MDTSLQSPPYLPFCYSKAKLGEANTEFRLLELMPSASEAQAAQLNCRILVSGIEQPAHEYKALSYSWGNGATPCSIAVLPAEGSAGEPRALAITESLHTALLHLRDARTSVWLWIDQVCINQQDDDEKGEQVRLMGPIYTRAEQVLVWLGPAELVLVWQNPEEHGSDALMEAWQTVGQEARDFGMESYYTKERWPLLSRIINNNDPDDPKTAQFHNKLLRSGAETLAPLIARQTLRHWFARSWFRRAWTVQEFCLCANTVFVCGTKSVQVELVMLAIQILHFSGARLMDTVYARALVPISLLEDVVEEPTSRLFSCRQRRRKLDRGEEGATGDQLHALLRKLYVGRDTQAKFPRDRVFSLLGLAVDTRSLDITPDYTNAGEASAEARMLTRAARAMITNPSTGRIDILCYSQFPKAPDLANDLPSWVPDWRGNLRPSFYTIHEAVETHLFSACGPETSVQPLPATTTTTTAHSLPRSALGLAGYLVDSISTIAAGAAWDDLSWDAARYLRFFAQVDAVIDHSLALTTTTRSNRPQFYPSEARRREARWRLPIGDLFWTNDGRRMRRAGEAEAARQWAQCVANVRFLDECEKIVDVAEQKRRMEEWDWQGKMARGELGEEYRESMSYMTGKKPFCTAEGYPGMGPAGVREGDVVVVFCGGRIPFVLRPVEQDGMFRFVGEAYCDGVMDGEVVGVRRLTEFYLV
ncbi:heterokaryon incompatibility protein-domain-containing protein [Chaetomium strumarium]|uniref:Heterokaryon incompatibility protein-domain-containing protein n=1 Tax=Chaetomium strumarium TaxID=1170767 RepID=A0AAJ0GRN0_9PEZI|nr:heterokaryon incompatibility protein-domain-containing protein [Chaetomium strumarium]